MNDLKTTSVLQKLYKDSTREGQVSLVVTHIIKKSEVLPKTKKFGCVDWGDLTLLFFSKVVK